MVDRQIGKLDWRLERIDVQFDVVHERFDGLYRLLLRATAAGIVTLLATLVTLVAARG